MDNLQPEPPEHICALTALALWLGSARGRSVVDMHTYSGSWIVTLHDVIGRPSQAHGTAENIHDAANAAIANYYSQRKAIEGGA